ncbi:GUN4 domain-containing protein [Microcoleus sp. herbarium8]|uniref:GUN4 domain-containing protein n=1 Tax=Microcoleus sp. herbarium8 TaxID=3055436 RepID=UPI002FD690E6
MSIQPREYDAVLGSNNTAAPTDAVLGGIEGVKRQMAITKVEQAFPSFPLISEAGIDYSFLQYLLAIQELEKADEQTRKLLLQAANRSDNWLRKEDIQSLACEDLFIIDRLWTIYSRGRFGFSIQKSIWENLCSEKWDRSRGEEFSDRVGWHKQKTKADPGGYHEEYTIKRREDILCGLNAPEGNLPSICESGGGELLSWYDPPDTESTMGFYWTGGYIKKWSQDSFFGAYMIACFLKRIQACPEIP